MNGVFGDNSMNCKEKVSWIIDHAATGKQSGLNEFESKEILSAYGIPVTREILVTTSEELTRASESIGYPLVLKGCSADISHKTEKNLVALNIESRNDAIVEYNRLRTAMGKAGEGVLVQEMIKGDRELVMGMTRDLQFGPCVMFGLGGIFTEILNDVSFRKAPLERSDALEMMREIRGHKILEAFRGYPAADMDKLTDMLIAIGQIALDMDIISEIDLNPVILSGTVPVAADALIILK